jgi:hypothetical protein
VQDVANIPAPGDIELVGFEGSNTTDLFVLIPLIMTPAQTFDLENNNIKGMRGNVVTHVDDLNAWLYGVCLSSIKETRYSVVPDNRETYLSAT